ncbi:unnamed protein product [Linum tenue]|uniref:Uncharacterized protein n=1 Tax=Linum tenue TaxID=586396 RepID=A0AAV0Q5U5_9ROSI|nr:unnamed protein product [Linum tenue]
MELAKDAIKQRSKNDKEKYGKFWELFEQRRRKNIVHPIHAASAFLNPAYMCSSNFREDRETKEGISFMHENLVKEEEKPDFMKEIQLYQMKVSTLFSPTSKTMLETSHPCKFN